MRAVGAYVVAVASAVALSVVSLMAQGGTGLESATDHDLVQKAGDLSWIVGITYVTMFSIALPTAALPFAVVLLFLRSWLSGLVAAGAAGCAAAAVVLILFVGDGSITFSGAYARLLPGALVAGLLGGVVYALAMQQSEPRGS